MVEAGLGELGAGEHAGDLVFALIFLHAPNAGAGAPVAVGLLDQEVLVGEGGNLRQMGNETTC